MADNGVIIPLSAFLRQGQLYINSENINILWLFAVCSKTNGNIPGIDHLILWTLTKIHPYTLLILQNVRATQKSVFYTKTPLPIEQGCKAIRTVVSILPSWLNFRRLPHQSEDWFAMTALSLGCQIDKSKDFLNVGYASIFTLKKTKVGK